MTTNKRTMALTELAEKGADVDLLREMIQFVAQRLMDMDVDTLCGAGYGERTAERINHRNGYRPRLWDTRAGSVDLEIPRLRKGSYFPGFLQPRRTGEKALVAVIQEAYIQGGLHPLGGRAGQVVRYDGHQQEPGLKIVRADRRAG